MKQIIRQSESIVPQIAVGQTNMAVIVPWAECTRTLINRLYFLEMFEKKIIV